MQQATGNLEQDIAQLHTVAMSLTHLEVHDGQFSSSHVPRLVGCSEEKHSPKAMKNHFPLNSLHRIKSMQHEITTLNTVMCQKW